MYSCLYVCGVTCIVDARTYNIHTYIHTHTYVRTYLHTYIYTYIHTYIHTYIRTYICTYIHTYIHAYKHTYIHTYIHAYIHAYIWYLTQVTYIFMRNSRVAFPQYTVQYNGDFQQPTMERSKASRGLPRCRSHVQITYVYFQLIRRCENHNVYRQRRQSK